MNVEQERQLAKNESTSAEKLRELASSNDLITRQNVVTNPNVPLDVLAKLISQFPRQVFNNPAIDLLLLENPNLFSGTSVDALCSLLKREVPHRMIEYAANSTDDRIKLAVLINPQTPQDILAELEKKQNVQVVEAAQLHINYFKNNSSDDREEFVRASIQQNIGEADKSYQEVLGVIDNFIKLYDFIPHCIAYYLRGGNAFNKDYSQLSLSELEKIADSGRWQELQFLGRNPNTPIPIIERILANGNANLYIAENPNLTVELIRKLLDRPDPYGDISRRIGINPSTPIEILEELANSNRHNAVHEAVALNPKTSESILEILLNKTMTTGYVYEALGRNKNISVVLLEKLVARSQDAYVSVFNNPITPENLKLKLLKYFKEKKIIPISKYRPQDFINNSYVPGDFLEECLYTRINDIQKIQIQKIKENYFTSLEVIAFHPNITPNGLKKLLDYDERSVRNSAIANCKTPQYITEWGMSFLESLNQYQLKFIAGSFYATEEILKALVSHKDIAIGRAAASNPCASDRILEYWENSPFYKAGSLEQIMVEEQRLLNQWKSSIAAANRLTVLLNSAAPVPILAQISRSTSWLERYTIAQNFNTPLPIVQRLAKDGNYIVRTTAKSRLANSNTIKL